MTYKYATLSKWITVVIDYLLLNMALSCCFWIESAGASFWTNESSTYRLNALLLNLLWFYSSSLVELYDNILTRDALPTLRAAITALLIYLTIPIVLTTTLSSIDLSLDFIINSFLYFSVFIIASRVGFLFIRKSRRRLWIKYKKVVIVGASAVGTDLYNYIDANSHLGYKVEGFFDDNHLQTGNNLRNPLGKVEDCIQYALTHDVTEIFCTLSVQEMEKIKMLMQEADKHLLRFRLVPDLSAGLPKNVMLELYGHLPILTSRKEPLDNKANEVVKRIFDVLFSSVVIILLLSWLIPILAVLIKLESKGPVFFKQLRSGKGNKPFYCYKFRSMTVNTDSDKAQASRDDIRITRVGAFLRKTSIDELPQFFNVLMGEMSVVGPRPHMLKHTQDYSVLINNFMVRHFLTPGITGWAQVRGYRGETKETSAMANRVEADLWYLENWTLFLDMKIILLTVWQVIRGNENAF